MSERAYEDGTPVGGEPRVEGWMRRAGLEISCLDLDGEFHRLMREQELRPEQVPPRLMNLLASIIAKHAPVPQPIRRGDVVQFARGYTPPAWQSGYLPGNDAFNPGDFEQVHDVLDGAFVVAEAPDVPIPLDAVVRIGRARYYPDGTPVED